MWGYSSWPPPFGHGVLRASAPDLGRGVAPLSHAPALWCAHHLCIHSSVSGQLGCFHVLATVKCAATNTEVHASLSIIISSGYMPSSGIVGLYGSSIPSFFFSNPYTVLHSGCINFSPIVQEGSLFSTSSQAFIVCRLFNDGYSDWCEMILHCSFYLHFSNIEMVTEAMKLKDAYSLEEKL